MNTPVTMTRTKNTRRNKKNNDVAKTITKPKKEPVVLTEGQLQNRKLNRLINPIYGMNYKNNGFKYRKLNEEICHAIFGYDNEVYVELTDRETKEIFKERWQRITDKYNDKLLVDPETTDPLMQDRIEQVIFTILCEKNERDNGALVTDLQEVGFEAVKRVLNNNQLKKLFYRDQLVDAIEKLIVLSEHVTVGIK